MKEEKVRDDQDNTAHTTINKIPGKLFLRIDVLLSVLILGITGLGNSSQGMKRRMKTIMGLVQFSCCIIIYRKIILG